MCFDIQSSLTAWIIANSISFYLYHRNRNFDRWNAAFITTFSTMQLVEAGIWWNMDGDNNMNSVLTKLVLLVLLAQPLVQSYMGYQFTQSSILFFISLIMLGVFIGGLFRIGSAKPGQFYTTTGPNGHLMWQDKKTLTFLGNVPLVILYFIGLLVPVMFMGWKGVPLLTIGVLTILYSAYKTKSQEFGSYWCFTAIAYAMVALFL